MGSLPRWLSSLPAYGPLGRERHRFFMRRIPRLQLGQASNPLLQADIHVLQKLCANFSIREIPALQHVEVSDCQTFRKPWGHT